MKCCELTAASLIHVADIQNATKVPDGQGGSENTWATVVPAVRCKVSPISSREQVHLDRLESTLASRMVMRYRSDVTAGMVVLFKGFRHNIRGVPRNIENRNRWLELDLEEGVAI